jgi:hypothetical protein
MFGNHPRLNPLAARKQMLIAESDLNRALLAGEVSALTMGLHAFATRAKTFGSIASAAALLVGGLAAWRRGSEPDAVAKPSTLQTILKLAGLLPPLWQALRPQARELPKP